MLEGSPAAQPARDLASAIPLLERVMQAQLEGHQRLLTLIERKRQAIRAADMAAITAACKQEHDVAHKLAELEKHRLELIGRLTQTLAPLAQRPLTVAQVAAAITGPPALRLLDLAQELRGALTELKRQSSIVRSAAEALNRHMTGIVHTVHSAFSRARVYGRGGQIDMGAPLSATLDIKT